MTRFKRELTDEQWARIEPLFFVIVNGLSRISHHSY